MIPLVAYGCSPVEPARGQALDALLREGMSAGSPAVLRLGVGARDGLAFGRYQLIPSVAHGSPGVQRRLTGGRAVPLGAGLVELSLAAPALTDFTSQQNPVSPDQLLNRAVRGVLRGLERLGLAVVYPGRDLITFKRRAVGHISFDIDREGRPLVQCQIAWRTSLAEAALRLNEAGCELSGRPDLLAPEECVTLAEALGETPGLDRVLEVLLEGYSEHVGAPIPLEPLPKEMMMKADVLADESFAKDDWLAERTPTASMRKTARVRSQLGGFLVALSLQEGRLGGVRLAGEFIADQPAVASIEEDLNGCPAEWTEVARVVDRVLSTPPHIVLGLGKRRTIPDTVMQAVSQPDGKTDP